MSQVEREAAFDYGVDLFLKKAEIDPKVFAAAVQLVKAGGTIPPRFPQKPPPRLESNPEMKRLSDLAVRQGVGSNKPLRPVGRGGPQSIPFYQRAYGLPWKLPLAGVGAYGAYEGITGIGNAIGNLFKSHNQQLENTMDQLGQ